MFPSMLFFSMHSRKKKKQQEIRASSHDFDSFYPFPSDNKDPTALNPSRFSLRSNRIPHHRNKELKAKKKGEISTRVSGFSNLIQRVAASCLPHPPVVSRQHSGSIYGNDSDYDIDELEEEEEGVRRGLKMVTMERVLEMEMLIDQVFDSISDMKTAYLNLQEAHCPWDAQRMRVADVAVVSELRKLGFLREKFRRCISGSGAEMLREVVGPYAAAVEELKKEVKNREAEVENLKETIKRLSCSRGKKGRPFSKRKVSCSLTAAQVALAPAWDLFEATMSQVKETSKSFTLLLFSLMRSAHWDIAAAVRSITENVTTTNGSAIASAVITHHAKFAIESYVLRIIFQGFDHETFYMDGSLSSLLNPEQCRRDCFAQYRDMKAMDPVELLGILPTCHFGKFCFKKFVAIVHPKMEESLFGNFEQRQQVLDGIHPRSEFYGEFLGLAKAIWLLHLLAFSLDPPPSQFEASMGAEFHPQYMESVVKFSGGRVPGYQVVGFPVSPGFKHGNGSIVKARVYLVPRP